MVAPTVNQPSMLRSWQAEFEPPWSVARLAPVIVALLAFVLLFQEPIRGLVHQWWTDPDSGHGLLLFPVSLWLAWKSGIRSKARPQVVLGAFTILFAVLIRSVGGLAAEFFTQRFAIWLALAGMAIYLWGFRQLLHWWLPFTLLLLSIPLPATITNSLAVPLQFRASHLGTSLIEWRNIPVQSQGNVIAIPGQLLFVAEACSGLRSLTALIALGVMIGGIWLRTIPGRLLIVLLAVPVAIFLNGVRIFLTAFLMYFVSPELGQGFMHTSEGWAIFVVALAILGLIAVGVGWLERKLTGKFRRHADA